MTAVDFRVAPLLDPAAAFGAEDIFADRLHALGYVTEEHLLEGGAGRDRIATRLLVRRPSADEASGVCVVEPMHFGGGRSFWGHAHEQLLRGGHTWVEVACQTHPVRTIMQPADPDRYSWVNLPGRASTLTPDIGSFADTRAASDAFASEWWATSPQLFTILNAALESIRAGAIPQLAARTILLAGASQSGGIVRRYAELVSGGDMPARADGLLPLHSGGQPLPAELAIPTYEVLAEAEIETVRSSAGLPGQARDLAHRDCVSPQYRFAEVPAMAHNDGRYALPAAAAPEGARWSRFAHTHIVHAALEGLIRWVEQGHPPLETEPLQADAAGRLIRDELGHPRGGLRTPAVEQPIARIRVISPGAHWSRGHEFPLPVSELRRRYGDVGGYLRQAEATLTHLVAGGHYLKVDAQRWLREAYDEAKEQI